MGIFWWISHPGVIEVTQDCDCTDGCIWVRTSHDSMESEKLWLLDHPYCRMRNRDR